MASATPTVERASSLHGEGVAQRSRATSAKRPNHDPLRSRGLTCLPERLPSCVDGAMLTAMEERGFALRRSVYR